MIAIYTFATNYSNNIMKKYDLLFMVFLFAFYVNANKVVKTVSQVSSAVVISDNVDYHITSAIPFTTTGSINITDTDNAVLILDSIRPSVAKNQLGYININGQAAVAGTNLTKVEPKIL